MPNEANMRGPDRAGPPGGTVVANPDGQVLRGGSVLVRYLNLVKFPHHNTTVADVYQNNGTGS